MRKCDTFSTGIKGIIGIQGIQSPLSDQCCPSTTDWYTGIKVYWVYKGYKANFWENEDTHLAGTGWPVMIGPVI